MPVAYRFRRNSALTIAAVCFSIALMGAAEAAGAFAVGVCGAYGYGFDFRNVTEARAAAIKKCTGGACKVVGDMRKGCAAIAVDAKNPCGSFGWAIEFPSRASGKHLDAPLLRIRRPRMRGARLGLRREGLEHDPEKWTPVFG